LVCSAFAGGSTMVLELASVRAIAPYFGSSTEVWTGAIGVVLLAMAAGYAIGGALAERGSAVRILGIALTVAGALVAATPWCLAPVARWFLPDDLGLDHAVTILRGGAVFTQGVLFGLPVFFAAFASPLLVRILADDGVAAGRAAGWVLFASTLGGLLGTFGTTYWLIPNVGVRASLYGTGLGLALLGMAALAADRRASKLVSSALLLVMAAGGTVGALGLRGPMKGPLEGEHWLAERETREQYVRVLSKTTVEADGRAGRETWLQINEGLDSFQSLDAPDRRTPGHYYDVLAFSALFAGEIEKPRIAIIGSGAGSTARALLEFLPTASIDAVELDAGVLELGREFLRLADLEARGMTTYGGVDGRVALRALRGPYDAILIDAYARQVEIPFHLVTVEMFQLCLDRLSDRGIIGINVSSFGRSDPVLLAIADTLAALTMRPGGEAPRIGVLPVRRDHNSVLVYRKGADLPTPPKFLEWVRAKGPRSPLVLQLAQFVCGPGGLWFCEPPEHLVPLTDDCAPMEKLQARSLALARKGWD